MVKHLHTHLKKYCMCITAQAMRYGHVVGMAHVSAFSCMMYHAEEFVTGKPEWQV